MASAKRNAAHQRNAHLVKEQMKGKGDPAYSLVTRFRLSLKK